MPLYRPSPTAALTLLIRSGRSADYKREMLKRLWSLVQAATGATHPMGGWMSTMCCGRLVSAAQR